VGDALDGGHAAAVAGFVHDRGVEGDDAVAVGVAALADAVVAQVRFGYLHAFSTASSACPPVASTVHAA
jgi:hypothetical protein